MQPTSRGWLFAVLLMCAFCAKAQSIAAQAVDNSGARPPVSKADIDIVKRARAILDSPAKWNRADTRVCPRDAKTYSLYCSLEKATDEVSGNFEHRGAAMQEARFVIDEVAPNANYDHRLMGYNNDPKTTFRDIQKVFDMLEERITKRLKEQEDNPQSAATNSTSAASRTKTEIQIVKRAKEILNSPSKWNRADTQNCPAVAKVFSLYCVLRKAALEVTGTESDGGPTTIARQLISETAPNAKSYKARLTDYNNDPTTSFEDVQKLLKLVEERLTKRLQQQGG